MTTSSSKIKYLFGVFWYGRISPESRLYSTLVACIVHLYSLYSPVVCITYITYLQRA